MATYLHVIVTGALWLFALVVGIVSTAVAAGLLTLVMWVVSCGLEQLVDLWFGDERLSDSVTAWSRVFLICCILFAPMGYVVASSVLADKPAVRERVSDSVEIRQYLLADYRPPKHVYVTLKDTKTNQVYNDMYVSKHCSFGVKIGDKMNVQVEIWHYKDDPDNKYLNFINLYSVVCS